MAMFYQSTTKSSTGSYVVHHDNCLKRLPDEEYKKFKAKNEKDAMKKAPSKPAIGCKDCMPSHHKL